MKEIRSQHVPGRFKKIEKALKADYTRLFVDTSSKRGKVLAEAFEADEFPHLVVIDRTGKVQVYWQTGTQTVEELASVLKTYRRAKVELEDEEAEEEDEADEEEPQDSNDSGEDDSEESNEADEDESLASKDKSKDDLDCST